MSPAVRRTRIRRLRLAAGSVAVALASAACLEAAGAATEAIGTAGAVNPASTQTPPGGATKVVEIGARVVHREKITTSASGSVQLLFIDKTSLNIGPNSSILIDEFVYDPQAGTGRMAVSVVQGVLRFVGGNASHTGGATIRMPSVTLGVRGGVVQAETNNGVDTGVLLYGRAEFSTGDQTQVVRRPGWGIRVGQDGRLGPPQKFDVGALAQLNARVIPPTSRGGGGQRPSEEKARQQLGSGAAGPEPRTITALQQQNVAEHLRGEPSRLIGNTTRQSGFDDTVRTSTNRQATQQTIQNGGPRNARYFALNMGRDTSLGAPVPYLPAAFVAAGTFRQSDVIGFFPGTDAGGAPRTARALQAGLNINGAGASQTSTIYLMTTSFSISDNTGVDVANGGFQASSRTDATQGAAFARGAVSAFGSDVQRDSAGVPTGGTFTQNGVSGDDQFVPQQAFFGPATGPLTATPYAYTQQATPSSYAGSPAGRPAAELFGFAGGLVQTTSASTGNAVGSSFPIAGFTFLGLDPDSSRVSGAISVFRDPLVSSATSIDDFSTAVFLLGFQGAGTGSRSAYVDYDNFGARDAASTSGGGPLAMVNTLPVSSFGALLVTSKTVQAESFFPGVTFCRCDYTRWGFWSAEINRDSPANSDIYRDRVHLGTWVAGQMTDVARIPTVGTATFTGHAIGSFHSGGAEYIAAGNMSAFVDFAAGSGSMSITNLDGRSYGGTLTTPTNGVGNFAVGTIPTTAGPTGSAGVSGFFFDGPAGPAREIAGQLTITGTGGYYGSASFAGSR